MASQDNMAVWRDCIRAWYPDYETKTYFVPPVVITKMLFDKVKVAGQTVFVPQCNPTQDNVAHIREDLSLQHVLFFLRELVSEQREQMFIISNLKFSSYLGEPCYAAAAKQFIRPQDFSKHHKQGDFDILVIHRHYGIITGEIKSVLSDQQLQSPQPDADRLVKVRVKKSIKQLNKSEVVLREITKDLEPNLTIRKLLILPYVTADSLTRVVLSNEQLKQDLVTCLQAVDFDQALQCCLLASSSETETANNQPPKTWRSTFSAFKPDRNMTSNLYLDLLARFCGPATTVSVYLPTSPRIEIRTEGQGVAVTGERMTLLVLTPEQISLLTRAPTKVWLTGPPGVGKSVMLVLMALTWLRQGYDVHLVSVWIASLAATRMINHMIQVSNPTSPSVVDRVHVHEYDFYNRETDVDKAINTLTATRGSHGTYVICDEIINHSHNARYHRFVTDLCMRLPNVCLWAASPFHNKRPEELQEERMTTPLRCPPAVLSEVQKGVNMYNDVHPYTTTTMSTPCDGPNVIHLSHQGPVHVGFWPLECVQCGLSIASILKRLEVGVADYGVNNHINTATTIANRTNVGLPLQYCDVFVLTRSHDIKDEAGFVTSTTHGVVRGLRDKSIPVRVIRSRQRSTDVLDTAVRKSNVVTVAYHGDVTGLERKVVVWLPGRIPGVDDKVTDDRIKVGDRFCAMSRCTAQLVVVDVTRV